MDDPLLFLSLRPRNEAGAPAGHDYVMFKFRSHSLARLDPDLSVDEIMTRWPAAIPVFLKHGFLCVGCAIGPFHTLTDACEEHGASEDLVMAEVLAAIERG